MFLRRISTVYWDPHTTNNKSDAVGDTSRYAEEVTMTYIPHSGTPRRYFIAVLVPGTTCTFVRSLARSFVVLPSLNIIYILTPFYSCCTFGSRIVVKLEKLYTR